MNKDIIIIKNKLDSKNPKDNEDILMNASNSFNKRCDGYYNSAGKDKNKLDELKKHLDGEQYILLVSYTGNGEIFTCKEEINKGEIESIYIGTGELHFNGAKYNIKYRMKKCITNKRVIANILDNIELDLKKDYGKESYIIKCDQKRLSKTIAEFLIEYNKPSPTGYHNNFDTYKLAEYAIHNEQCKRLYSSTKEDKRRNEFQRDRERIVNSKAFRRLVDKAQIFSAEKGDHYRTRMTHTLEVNQIAKAIASALNLNLDLTEAIALAHDLGHTPFGHQGERTLYNILSGKELENMFKMPVELIVGEGLGGFKHNFQSVRMLTKLEEKYIEYKGLDISFQVLEGILKHTEMKKAKIEDLIDHEIAKELHTEQSFATTLEGQVVAVADEIAQRGHDVDDALSSGLITIDELIDYLSIEKFDGLKLLLVEQRKKIDEYYRVYVDETEMKYGRIISCIVNYFINDVIINSERKIEDFFLIHPSDISKGVFLEKLVDFSVDQNGENTCKFLEKVIKKKVISDTEVARFDYNANIIIRELFLSYYLNPKLLHKGTLRKIFIDILQHPNQIVSATAIDFSDGNTQIIQLEIDDFNSNEIIFDTSGKLNEENYLIYEKRKIFIRNIVDFIAGMTDSYALSEYKRIKH